MDELIQQNAIIIDQYNVSPVRRRLKKELEKMYPNFAQIEVTLDEKHKLQVTIYEITDQNQMHKYGFEITPNYPFTAPIMSFQDRPYPEFLKVLHTPKEYNLFKKVTGLVCFCCSSLNCPDNWSPATKLTNIIEEVHRIKSQKRKIIYKLIVDKIKWKYLIDDIDLDSWLFSV